MTCSSLLRRSLGLAVVLALLLAAPAGAHPFVQGGELPVDSLATMTLDLAHGCDSEDEGAGEDTTEVALEVPDWLRVVDVPEPDGWAVELDHGDDGTVVQTVIWTTDDPEQPAPTFDLDVVAEGEVGDERYLGVFQACDDLVYRWIGTPEDPADDPAVRVVLTEADPDSPPPPEPDPDAEAAPDVAAASDAEDAEEDGTTAPDDEAEAQDDAEAEDDAADAEVDEVPDLDAEDAVAADDGGTAWLVLLAVLVILAAVGAFVAVRARRRAPHLGD